MPEDKSLVLFLNIPFGIEGKFHPGSLTFVGDDAAKASYLNALRTELQAAIQEGDFEETRIEAVYFGGGSPSVLGLEALKNFTERMLRKLPIVPAAEISIEAFPHTFGPHLAEKALGDLNRVNLQAISMQDEELEAIGAPHTSDDIRNAIDYLDRQGGCTTNVNVMYGLPGQTEKSLHATVRSLCRMGCKQITLIPHQPKGAELIAVGKNHTELFVSARDYLLEKGFEQRFFNFFRRAGNNGYYEAIYANADVISFGAGAYACCDGCRYVITGNQKRYVNNADDNEILLEIVIDESPEDAIRRLITGYLSQKPGLTGIHLKELRADDSLAEMVDAYLDDLRASNLIKGDGENGFTLTDKGQVIWYDTAREKGLLI